ncbi:methyltransferase domain-containing protein [Streptomyces sp. TRM43335]|uniref:Methyltransferase domain-containing protein n=1 Tax=Streptomyces taklimakanensis TaxID=2569853 RepID=A0A6G2BIV8_9ACTN|nr:class I SAM-dependent methyltransferase [Streptomyces taklimakanensis]MTE22180.1 methyltransferase domain-containing protein [Streptomyces taklimakanensis]
MDADEDGTPSRGTVRHPLFARYYARFAPALDERAGVGAHRTELSAGLSGRVVEVGAGSGLNFARYPPTVRRVVAVEPEPELRRLARDAASRAPVPVDVVPGTAEELPLDDGEFDAAVVSLVLCSVRDLERALAELRRVLRPGGELRFYEHVRARGPVGFLLQRALDRTVWPRLFGGCHTGRDPVAAIGAAGFVGVSHRRLRVPERGLPTPVSAHVLGGARRP